MKYSIHQHMPFVEQIIEPLDHTEIDLLRQRILYLNAARLYFKHHNQMHARQLELIEHAPNANMSVIEHLVVQYDQTLVFKRCIKSVIRTILNKFFASLPSEHRHFLRSLQSSS